MFKGSNRNINCELVGVVLVSLNSSFENFLKPTEVSLLSFMLDFLDVHEILRLALILPDNNNKKASQPNLCLFVQSH